MREGEGLWYAFVHGDHSYYNSEDGWNNFVKWIIKRLDTPHNNMKVNGNTNNR